MDEDAKRPKSCISLLGASGHGEGIDEGDGWIDGERTHVLVSSEEKLVVESRPGSDPDELRSIWFGCAARKKMANRWKREGQRMGLPS